MEAETGLGAGVACGPAGPGMEGGSPRRSGPVRQPGPTGLISKGKKIKRGFNFRI
jgi:hypothetical protein